MPLEYNQPVFLEGLNPVIDEHAEWYARVLRRAFYPEYTERGEGFRKPGLFPAWIRELEKKEIFEAATLRRLQALYDDMNHLAGHMMSFALNSGQKPEIKIFDALSTLYEEFINQMRRLEKDFLLRDSGLDPLTGLRTRQAMTKDMEREMDRLARHGKTFSLAVSRIDDFAELEKQLDHEKLETHVRAVAGIIKQSLRSFDDAYYSRPGEFVLCLKQSDVPAGLAALERIRRELEKENIQYSLNGKNQTLTISCCICEPVATDDIEELLKNLRRDLEKAGKDNDTVLEYNEMSALQRYVQSAES